ncbi:MAG: zinc ribbon domain-containing protein [Candidatus Brockarchaeota archaeon]|nr:zinc ribbon domain-containing protein [Candidatus Brockarchaeota archaeon]
MRLRGVAVATLAVLLFTMALSYITLKAFSGFETIRVGSKQLKVSSLSPSEDALWASLLGLSAMGFGVGSAVAPGNVAFGLLVGSYSGEWIFKAIITLVIAGALGGIIVEYGSGATVASALGTLLALCFGAVLTLRTLPSLLEGVGMSAGELQEFVSAVAVSQFVGALAASLVAGLAGGLVARLMLRRSIVRVEPLKLPPPPPPNGIAYRFCPNCGFDLSDFSEHRSTCPKCGERIPGR